MGEDRGHHSRPVQWRADRRPTDPSRLAAYDILRAVHADEAYANLVAPQVIAEAELHGQPATTESFRRAAEAELAEARPLPGNAFKVPLARNTIVRTLRDLVEEER